MVDGGWWMVEFGVGCPESVLQRILALFFLKETVQKSVSRQMK